MSSKHEFILTLSCRDAKGIVYAVSGLLFHADCNILDSQQYGDVLSGDATGLFFMRVHFVAARGTGRAGSARSADRAVCASAMRWTCGSTRWRASRACC